MTPLAVVGDVHGDAVALERATTYLASLDRQAVFVGDYVNRGTDSKRVLDLLLTFAQERPDAQFLLGNHDAELLKVLNGGPTEWFLSNGGLLTIRSYLGARPNPRALIQFIAEFPAEHREFLQSLRTHIETDEVLISHTGYDPGAPYGRALDDVVMRGHPGIFAVDAPRPAPFVICGHYVQYEGPVLMDRFACIDTGCGSVPGAPLTVLLYPEVQVEQFEGQDA